MLQQRGGGAGENDSEGGFFKMDVLNLIARSSKKTSIILIQIFASEDDDVIK